MVGVYSRGLTASNPQKYPPGPATEKLAAEMYMQDKPGVLSTGMTLPVKKQEVDIEGSRALTAANELKRKEEADAADRLVKADAATKAEVGGRDFRKKLKVLETAEKADTPEKKAAIRERELNKVKEAKRAEFKVNPPAAPVAAPAAAAKPVAKFNPTTGKWEQ